MKLHNIYQILEFENVISSGSEPQCTECCTPNVRHYSDCFKQCIQKCVSEQPSTALPSTVHIVREKPTTIPWTTSTTVKPLWVSLPIRCLTGSIRECPIQLSSTGGGSAAYEGQLIKLSVPTSGGNSALFTSLPLNYTGRTCMRVSLKYTASTYPVTLQFSSSSGDNPNFRQHSPIVGDFETFSVGLNVNSLGGTVSFGINGATGAQVEIDQIEILKNCGGD